MTEPFIYKTIARFSDTDLYGVVHHSSYFCWMEEARMQLMEDVLQMSLDQFLKEQIQFPVVTIEGKYIQSVIARQEVTVNMLLLYNKSTKLKFQYDILNEKQERVFSGRTEHVLTKNNKLLFIVPEFLEQLISRKLVEFEDKYIVLEN